MVRVDKNTSLVLVVIILVALCILVTNLMTLGYLYKQRVINVEITMPQEASKKNASNTPQPVSKKKEGVIAIPGVPEFN